MKFKELQKEDYAFVAYENLKSFLILHNQLPIQIIRIDNAKTAKFIIIKQSQLGLKLITTRQFNIPLEDAPFFTSWLGNDFADVDFQHIGRDTYGENA